MLEDTDKIDKNLINLDERINRQNNKALFDNRIDKLLTVREVASILNCAIKTIRNWVYKNEIPYRKVGRKMVRFSRVEIDQWLTDGRN